MKNQNGEISPSLQSRARDQWRRERGKFLPPLGPTQEERRAARDAEILAEYGNRDEAAIRALVDLNDQIYRMRYVEGYKEGRVKAANAQRGYNSAVEGFKIRCCSAIRSAIGYHDPGYTESAQDVRALRLARDLIAAWDRAAEVSK